MTTEQMAVIGTEQHDTASEQAIPVADPQEVAVAEAADRAVAEIDLSTPEGVRAAAEKYPALKAVFADYENTGKQRTLSEINRDRGTLENIRNHNREIARRLALGEDPDEIANETPLYVKANQEVVTRDMFRAIYEQAKAADPDAVAALDAFVDAPDVSSEQMQRYAQAALNAVSGKAQRTATQKFLESEDLDALPDSPLKTAIQNRVAREVEIELNARKVEASKPDIIPVAPAGTSPEPMNRARLEAMTPAERLAYATKEAEAGRSLWEVAMSQS